MTTPETPREAALKLKRIVRDYYNKTAGFAEVMDVASVIGLPLDDRLVGIIEMARKEAEA
jgi:hypothetical protein